VLDHSQAGQVWAPTETLKSAGVELFVNDPVKVRKVHHKLMVIDRQIVILGSFNYTGPATNLNDENIVVLGDLEETKPEAKAAQTALASYVLDEIDRITTGLAFPV
jgi:phosphatidylserine/phosphatidylglycerophosphate/cardiolipin synthase-like enzyme